MLETGIAQINEGLAVRQSIGVQCYLPGILSALAEAQAMVGHPEEGLTTLAEALTTVEKTGELHWKAEFYRLKGEILLMQGNESDAEANMLQAIKVAHRQQAKLWELRAATSLARLWQQQGKQTEARHVLVEIYNWFSEGFDTPDLIEAKALLDDLSHA